MAKKNKGNNANPNEPGKEEMNHEELNKSVEETKPTGPITIKPHVTESNDDRSMKGLVDKYKLDLPNNSHRKGFMLSFRDNMKVLNSPKAVSAEEVSKAVNGLYNNIKSVFAVKNRLDHTQSLKLLIDLWRYYDGSLDRVRMIKLGSSFAKNALRPAWCEFQVIMSIFASGEDLSKRLRTLSTNEGYKSLNVLFGKNMADAFNQFVEDKTQS